MPAEDSYHPRAPGRTIHRLKGPGRGAGSANGGAERRSKVQAESSQSRKLTPREGTYGRFWMRPEPPSEFPELAERVLDSAGVARHRVREVDGKGTLSFGPGDGSSSSHRSQTSGADATASFPQGTPEDSNKVMRSLG